MDIQNVKDDGQDNLQVRQSNFRGTRELVLNRTTYSRNSPLLALSSRKREEKVVKHSCTA